MKESSLPSIVTTITKYLLLSGLIAAPLVIIPVFMNFIVTSKLLVLFITAAVLLAIFIWRTLKQQTIELPRSPLVIGLGLVGLSSLASSILAAPYPNENLLGMGGVYLATALIGVIGCQFLANRTQRVFINTLTVASTLLAISTLAEFFGYGPSYLINQVLPLNIANNNLFNLSGALVIAAQIMGVTLIGNVVESISKKRITLLQGLALPIIVIGFGISLFGLLPGKPANPSFLPFSISWNVAIDSLKTPKTALIGFGPENYADAFQRFKPATVNTTAWWNSVVGQGSNAPLTILPTLGLFGLAAWIFLVVRVLSESAVNGNHQPGIVAVVLCTFGLQLVIPPSPVMLWIQAIALAFMIANRQNAKQTTIHLFKISAFDSDTTEKQNNLGNLVPVVLPVLIAGLALGLLLWPIGKAYAASHYFFRSLLAQEKNDFISMYESQQKAVQLNRYISSYRSNFALISLTAANALASKENPTEEDKQQASILIQQAVSEARAATALRPNDAQTWQVLGQVYANLIRYQAEGSSEWTTLAYTQAIQNNPSNPILRLQLGTVLYNQDKFEDAGTLFSQALGLKPDLASAAYSLANAFVRLQQPERAKAAYEQTLTLLDPDSEDYKTAQKELQALEAQITSAQEANPQTTTQKGSGTLPTPTPTSQVPSVVNQNVTQSSDEAVEQSNPSVVPNLNDQESSPSATPSP